MESVDIFDPSLRAGASLRDPAGFVLQIQDRIYRYLRAPAAATWVSFSRGELGQRLLRDGLLISTAVADSPGLPAGDEGLLVKHERVDVMSYASEWTFTMLRDAALLHLDLMDELVPAGWSLKDASPANVQWHKGHLCFIDVASIEPYECGPWRAYGQFCRLMLFPLMAAAYGGHPLKSLLRGFGRDGLDARDASRLIGIRSSFKPGALLHVHLQSWLQNFSEKRRDVERATELGAKLPAEALIRMLRGLRRTLLALPFPQPTKWTTYTKTSPYSDEQSELKRATIVDWCSKGMTANDVALDVGCNTGAYSSLLAQYAGRVIAIDADMSCVDEVYRRKETRVLPLVVDIADPTPAGGWALNEQQAFTSRVRPTWSVWLAVIHHLAIHNGVRLDAVVNQICKLSTNLIVEFVAPEDDMVRALLRERGVDRPDYTEVNYLRLLEDNGVEVVERVEITLTRRLYLLQATVSVAK